MKIPFQKKLISDLQDILEKVYEDDKKGGFNHYHDWCEDSRGHVHTKGKPHTPFVLTSDALVTEALGNFFTRITQLPRTGKLWFVEMSGGINKNAYSESASRIDVSFEKIGKQLRDNVFPNDWLYRIHGVIHPLVSDVIRAELDEKKDISFLEKTNKTIASVQKNHVVLQMYGVDDFLGTEKFLTQARVPNIYHFEHDGMKNLQTNAHMLSSMLLEQIQCVNNVY